MKNIWISTKERLPIKDGFYVVAYKKTKIPALWDNDKNCFTEICACDKFAADEILMPLYWMEMPPIKATAP